MQVLGHVRRVLRLERLLRDWTRADLSEAAGVSEAQIWRIEKGKQTPKLETVDKILVALGISFADFSRRCLEVAELRDPPQGPRGGPFGTPVSPALLNLTKQIARGCFETDEHYVVLIPKPPQIELRKLRESRESDE